MFIATIAYPKDLAPLGAKPAGRTIAEAGKDDCAPPELKSKERRPSYKHLAPLGPLSGEATNNIALRFEVEFNQLQIPKFLR